MNMSEMGLEITNMELRLLRSTDWVKRACKSRLHPCKIIKVQKNQKGKGKRFITTGYAYTFEGGIGQHPLTPVAGLFLTRLGFENIFKTQGIFKIKERFLVMLE